METVTNVFRIFRSRFSPAVTFNEYLEVVYLAVKTHKSMYFEGALFL